MKCRMGLKLYFQISPPEHFKTKKNVITHFLLNDIFGLGEEAEWLVLGPLQPPQGDCLITSVLALSRDRNELMICEC